MAWRNNGIKNVASVNRSCSEEPVLELILHADGQEILFQQPRLLADIRLPAPNITKLVQLTCWRLLHSGAGSTYISRQIKELSDVRNNWTVLALLIFGTVALVVVLNRVFPGALVPEEGRLRLVYGLSLLTLVGSGIVLGWRQDLGVTLKHGLVWAGIFVGLLVIYSYRADFADVASRVIMEVMPSEPVIVSPGAVSLRKDVRGHFVAMASVEGTRVRFLVDTGATSVALNESDAKRIGIDISRLSYVIPVSTANGQTFAAPIELRDITIGDIRVENIPATVIKDSDQSLLGMSFLSRLNSYEVNQDTLILRK